jgi:hypothetical protein
VDIPLLLVWDVGHRFFESALPGEGCVSY